MVVEILFVKSKKIALKILLFIFPREIVDEFDSGWGRKPFRNFSQNYNYLS